MKRTRIPCLLLCLFALAVVSTRAATPAEQAEAFHERGLAAEQRGDLVAAENCYSLALRTIANHPAAIASMAELEEKLPVKVTPTASHTFAGDRLDALNDGKEPSSSKDSTIPRFTWYPNQASLEWVQYDFAKPQAIEGCSVYWFNDNGGVKLPEFWKVLYLDDSGIWMPVDGQPSSPALNAWNTCQFKSVRTRGLRLAAQLGSASAGILEWKIIHSSNQTLPLFPQPEELRLDDLIPITAKTGWGSFQVNRYTNLKGSGINRVLLDGKPCARFLFAHANSRVSYAVPQGYARFFAMGIGPTGAKFRNYTWSYKVFAGETPIFESRLLESYPGMQVPIEIELPAGTSTITLVTDANGDGGNDHAIWANPRLIAGPAPLRCSPETEARLAQLAAEFLSARSASADKTYAEAITLLQTRYRTAVTAALANARRGPDLSIVAALEKELSLATLPGNIPETDPDGTPGTIAQMRTIYREQSAAASSVRDKSLQALYDRYDAELAALEVGVAAKPEDTAAVKSKRQSVATERSAKTLP